MSPGPLGRYASVGGIASARQREHPRIWSSCGGPTTTCSPMLSCKSIIECCGSSSSVAPLRRPEHVMREPVPPDLQRPRAGAEPFRVLRAASGVLPLLRYRPGSAAAGLPPRVPVFDPGAGRSGIWRTATPQEEASSKVLCCCDDYDRPLPTRRGIGGFAMPPTFGAEASC